MNYMRHSQLLLWELSKCGYHPRMEQTFRTGPSGAFIPDMGAGKGTSLDER